MGNIEFRIIELQDGRYLVVREAVGSNTMDKPETIVGWEADCRNTSKCYAEIAEWMVYTGEIHERAARVTYVRNRA